VLKVSQINICNLASVSHCDVCHRCDTSLSNVLEGSKENVKYNSSTVALADSRMSSSDIGANVADDKSFSNPGHMFH
jgi:hypothetical protein